MTTTRERELHLNDQKIAELKRIHNEQEHVQEIAHKNKIESLQPQLAATQKDTEQLSYIERVSGTVGRDKKELERLEQPPAETTTAPHLGWLCPACGRGNAPWNVTCPCGPKVTITYRCGGPGADESF